MTQALRCNRLFTDCVAFVCFLNPITWFPYLVAWQLLCFSTLPSQTGANGDANTCTSAANLYSCCYKSCRALNKCEGNFGEAKCSWSTCYDDVHMTTKLIEHLGERMCLDLDNIYVSGVSNGGMVSFTIAQAIPSQIAGVVPIFGLPLIGHLDVPQAASTVPYLFLSGRQDTVVPIDGSLSAQGWKYVAAEEAAAEFAKAHGCAGSSTSIETPYDGGKINFACTEHARCSSGAGFRVVTCLYDGGHSTPPGRVTEGITWWFLSQYMPNGFRNSSSSSSNSSKRAPTSYE